jgi:hypothetical protein
MGLFSMFSRADEDKPVNRSAIRAKPNFEFRGVEVIPDANGCCKAVEALAGRRLLADEAPQLPMSDCDKPSCECRFQQYSDRRTDLRRDADAGIGTMADMFVADNARADQPGRRAADQEND